MGFGAQGSERHAGCGKAFADVFNRLHLVDRDRAFGRGQDFEKIAECDRRVGQHRVDIFFIILRLACFVGTLDAHIRVEALEDGRSHGMHFAAATEAVVTGVAEFAGFDRHGFGIGHGVAGQGLDGDFLEADAFNLGGRALEAFLDEFGGNADGFEDLRATVAVDDRDAHFGHDLEDAGFDGFAVVDDRLGEIAVGAVALEKFANGLEGEVGIDCRRTEADEAGDLVHIAGFAGLANQAGAHAFPNANQVVVHSSHGEEHRSGNPPVVDSRVRENEDACASIDRRLGIGADAFDGRFEPFFALGGVPECRNCGGFVFAAYGLNCRQLLVQENGRLKAHEAGVLGRFGEHVFAPAEHCAEAHHELLADRIDRRVGDLCEELLEVGVEQAWLGGQDCERCVIPHRAHGFGAVFEHGFDDHVHFLGRIAEGDLTLGEREDVEFARG